MALSSAVGCLVALLIMSNKFLYNSVAMADKFILVSKPKKK
jgi:hypothetical protein